MTDWKKTFKRVWHFIWEEDSFWSWVVNIILAFVLIKFVVYPGLGWVLATSHPVVAVVSGSMEHKMVHPCLSFDAFGTCASSNPYQYEICGTTLSEKRSVSYTTFWEMCGSWYAAYNITSEEFGSYHFKNGFNTGDIIVLKGSSPANIEIGDVIVFKTPYRSDPIIHRVVEIKNVGGKRVFSTKGDHNGGQGPVDQNISENAVIGKAFFRIPFLGYVKIMFIKIVYGVVGLFN